MIRRSAVGAQILVALLLIFLWLRAPARGQILVVPLTASAAEALPSRLFARDGRTHLLGRGPLPRSLVVEGSRSAVGRAAGTGALLLAAPDLLCGNGRA